MASFVSGGNELKVVGDLDADAEDQLKAELEKLVMGGGSVVTVDLSQVGLTASVCIGALVVLCIDLRAMGRRAQCVLSPGVAKTLDTVGLTSVLMREEEDAAQGAA
jgi:anti-anti-sigma factor